MTLVKTGDEILDRRFRLREAAGVVMRRAVDDDQPTDVGARGELGSLTSSAFEIEFQRCTGSQQAGIAAYAA